MSISTAVAFLLVGAVYCAPPIEPELDPAEAPMSVDITTIKPAVNEAIVEISDSIEKEENNEATVAPTIEVITVGYPTSPPPPHTTRALSGPERHALISHLSEYDLRTVDPLVLTPRQQVAILQELEHQELGLPPFTDPTPWQRLSREQQMEFNRKYQALRVDLQEYSRNQFLSLPEDRQAHAYGAFLSVDLQTLSQAIERELKREKQVLQQESFLEQQNLSEQQHKDEEQHLVKHQHVVEQQQLVEFVEQQRINEERETIEQQRIEENKLEQKQQQEINQLFEFVNEEEAKSPTGNRLSILQNVREDAKFQHFKPVKQNLPQVKSLLTPEIEIQPESHQPKKEGLLPTKQSALPNQHNTPSLRELKRKQKRLNIRRLNFDPRRRQ